MKLIMEMTPEEQASHWKGLYEAESICYDNSQIRVKLLMGTIEDLKRDLGYLCMLNDALASQHLEKCKECEILKNKS